MINASSARDKEMSTAARALVLTFSILLLHWIVMVAPYTPAIPKPQYLLIKLTDEGPPPTKPIAILENGHRPTSENIVSLKSRHQPALKGLRGIPGEIKLDNEFSCTRLSRQ